MSRCVECKANVARYWGSHLCEDCFRKILREEIKVKQAADVNVETAANKWF